MYRNRLQRLLFAFLLFSCCAQCVAGAEAVKPIARVFAADNRELLCRNGKVAEDLLLFEIANLYGVRQTELIRAFELSTAAERSNGRRRPPLEQVIAHWMTLSWPQPLASGLRSETAQNLKRAQRELADAIKALRDGDPSPDTGSASTPPFHRGSKGAFSIARPHYFARYSETG